MIEIHFDAEHDAKMLYKCLKNEAKHAYKETGVFLTDQTVIIHIPKTQQDYIKQMLIPKLVQFIIKVKEMKWLRSILENSFYYTDREEQNQILHIAQSILNGRRRDIPRKRLKKNGRKLLVRSFEGFLQDPVSFSFESYVRFRLKEYMAYLDTVSELAIDEYKLEQEYQAFIETLRQQVSKRTARLSCLHLVYNGNFIFYDDKGLRLNQEKLVQYIDEGLVRNRGMYVDETVIAPLLSIAPKTIYLYTMQRDHNMIVTIQNVFQERVKLYSVCEFEKRMRNL
ncbi:MAG: putative sporulation protein YtxC [Ectobacillus sp.]